MLVEWPERAGSASPKSSLRVTLLGDGDGRKALIDGEPAASARLQRCSGDLELRKMLASPGPNGAISSATHLLAAMKRLRWRSCPSIPMKLA